ncbi:hypothetical protein LMG26686_00183 [Achromobacter mucicolens]|uniref:hypothetical protein n=1 Tax=Achromobacter mucicolens TaxID=1389922 RepID=UPI001468EE0B|nr:hypothetical protein [Achromobacter mucicolens]CAB3815854.1 hypothetical protein LMG26686_00183 [Achromobacter mucicolens]
MTIIFAGKVHQFGIIVFGSDLAAGRNMVLDVQGIICHESTNEVYPSYPRLRKLRRVLVLRNITGAWGSATHDWKAAMNQTGFKLSPDTQQFENSIKNGVLR